jgi:hypothetical protein
LRARRDVDDGHAHGRHLEGRGGRAERRRGGQHRNAGGEGEILVAEVGDFVGEPREAVAHALGVAVTVHAEEGHRGHHETCDEA